MQREHAMQSLFVSLSICVCMCLCIFCLSQRLIHVHVFALSVNFTLIKTIVKRKLIKKLSEATNLYNTRNERVKSVDDVNAATKIESTFTCTGCEFWQTIQALRLNWLRSSILKRVFIDATSFTFEFNFSSCG